MMCHDVRRMSGNLFLKNIKREILFSCFPEIDVLPYPWHNGQGPTGRGFLLRDRTGRVLAKEFGYQEAGRGGTGSEKF